MVNPFGIVYKVQNRLNGKVYIGQTRQSLPRRRGEHLYRYRHSVRDHLIYKALSKYGPDNFAWQVLAECASEKSLNETERALIAEHDSYHHGYNMTEGGDGVSTETRRKLSSRLRGRKITWATKIVAARRKNGSYYGHIVHAGGEHKRARSYLVIEPDGTRHHVCGLRQWCRNWEKDRLHHPNLIDVAKGRRTDTKGYKCSYLDQERSETTPNGGTLKRVEMGGTQ